MVWPVAYGYECVCEVLAVTWQSGQGGAEKGLLITVGGTVCVSVKEWETDTEIKMRLHLQEGGDLKDKSDLVV